ASLKAGVAGTLPIMKTKKWAVERAMLDHMPRRSRSLLSLSLTSLALALSVLAFCTSYWCEGTHKVVKPLCLSPVKMKNCGQNNSEPYTTDMGEQSLGSHHHHLKNI
ncbi:hypothetical protein NFI96_006556, partial [Prochilodus magdalenae]